MLVISPKVVSARRSSNLPEPTAVLVCDGIKRQVRTWDFLRIAITKKYRYVDEAS